MGGHGQGVGPGAITRWSALLFGYMILAGPGVMAPRRQLVRLAHLLSSLSGYA
jgi:hypothetical protein